MKVAICISGLCRGQVQRNIEIIKQHFPYDIFYATWTDQAEAFKQHLGDQPVHLFDQPKMNYHPIRDIPFPVPVKLKDQQQGIKSGQLGQQFYDKTLHHTKQILIHSYLLRQIPDEYDMIIRTRYDAYLSPQVDFSKWLKKSYEENIAIGFGTRASRHRNIHSFKTVPKIYPSDPPRQDQSQDWGWYIMDPLIMHPRNLFDVDYAQHLHDTHKLQAAEFGWYQVLSEPYSDSHLCVYGGVQIERWLRGQL